MLAWSKIRWLFWAVTILAAYHKFAGANSSINLKKIGLFLCVYVMEKLVLQVKNVIVVFFFLIRGEFMHSYILHWSSILR